MLYLTACTVQNTPAVLRADMDFARILHESEGQSVSLFVLSALTTAENSELCPDLAACRTRLVRESAKKALARRGSRAMVQSFADAGFEPILIKGESLAMLYPNPLLRTSVDTDLYFPDHAHCIAARDAVLAAGGVLVHDLDSDGKHYHMEYPGAGCVELHISLLTDRYEASVLGIEPHELITEPFRELTTPDGFCFRTLGVTDALKYNFCHMISHFLFNRCDMRHFADIASYVRAYKDQIDRDSLCAFLDKIGKHKLFDTVLGAAVRYLGFAAADLLPFSCTDEATALLVADCLDGCLPGVWRKSPLTRGRGVVSAELCSTSRMGYVKRLVQALFRQVLFPKKTFLRSMFPYYAEKSYLLPVAWLHNIGSMITGAIRAHRRHKKRGKLMNLLEITK